MFGGEWRAAVLIAPPGYGKTMAVRDWLATRAAVCAWVSFDLVDHDDPGAMWQVVSQAVARVAPGLGELDGLLAAAPQPDPAPPAMPPGPAGATGSAGATGHTEPSGSAGASAGLSGLPAGDHDPVVVLDGVPMLADFGSWRRFALLIERARGSVRFVLTARTELPLPFSRWRSEGWLAELRESDLRMTDEEAVAFVEALSPGLDRADVVALNRRLGGWPIALDLTVLAARDGDQLAAAARGRTDPDMIGFLVGEVLDTLPEPLGDAMLALATVDWFDPEIALALAGPSAPDAIAELRRRRLIERAEDHRDAFRFQPLVQELFVTSLRWRDPSRPAELRREAARVLLERGDAGTAYRMLVARDPEGAHGLVLGPSLDRATHGDRAGIGRLLRELPAPGAVDELHLATDLALAALLAGDLAAARDWADRAEDLGGGRDRAVRRRLLTVRAHSHLMQGALDAAAAAVEQAVAEPAVEPVAPFEQVLTTAAVRVHLIRGELDAASRWLRDARAVGGDSVLADVTLPGLEAWGETVRGLPLRAIRRMQPALRRIDDCGLQHYTGAIDTLTVVAWSHALTGGLADARRLAAEALAAAEELGHDWHLVCSGSVAAVTAFHTAGPTAARAQVRRIRRQLTAAGGQLVERLDAVEAVALRELGQPERAWELVAHSDVAAARLLRSWLLADRGERDAAIAELAGSGGWAFHQRIEAALVTALASDSEELLRDALEEAATAGVVLPFLSKPGVPGRLAGTSLVQVHPRLAEVLRDGHRTALASALPPAERFTPRELTVLELLPSHLSYAEIAGQLGISVNTVKACIKSIYRRLYATGRSEAVEAARERGLV